AFRAVSPGSRRRTSGPARAKRPCKPTASRDSNAPLMPITASGSSTALTVFTPSPPGRGERSRLLGSPMALDFAVESVAYRSNPYIKMPEGYGAVLSPRSWTQEAIIRALVRDEGGDDVYQ